MPAASWARCDVPQRSKLALSKLASRIQGAQEPALVFKSGLPGHASQCTVTSSACDVRAASWAPSHCDVPPLDALALSELVSRAPGAQEQALVFKSGPSGHASPCTVTSLACDVRAASWASCDVPPLSTLALSELASRAPGAQEQALVFKSGLLSHGSSCTVTSSTRDVRAASWASCYVPPLSTLALSELASWAPGAQEPVLVFKSGLLGHCSL